MAPSREYIKLGRRERLRLKGPGKPVEQLIADETVFRYFEILFEIIHIIRLFEIIHIIQVINKLCLNFKLIKDCTLPSAMCYQDSRLPFYEDSYDDLVENGLMSEDCLTFDLFRPYQSRLRNNLVSKRAQNLTPRRPEGEIIVIYS